MKPRTVIYGVVLLVLVLFIFVNWGITTEVTVLVHRGHISLGALVAILAAALLLLDSLAHATSLYSWQRERRALEQDVQQLRLRAEQAEGSRLMEMRTFLERELAGIRAQLDRVSRASTAPPVAGAPTSDTRGPVT